MRSFSKIAVTAVFVSVVLGSVLGGTEQRRPQNAQAQGGGERSGPAQPPLWLPDEEYLRWPLPPSEKVYARLDDHRIKGYINEITAISRKSRDDGNQYWGRITGTPYDKMTTDWVAAQFTRIGLETRVQEFTDLPEQWWPTSWEVSVRGGGKSGSLKTAFPPDRTLRTNSQA